jgi:TetR/AcrR family transcriptional regulator
MSKTNAPTRIQRQNRARILDAALVVFSAHGYAGATLDEIASGAGLSKPNVLYYFPSKEAIYTTLLEGLLETWLEPLKSLRDDADPVDEIIAYVLRKLEMSRQYPRESRLFANEILQGAPRMLPLIERDLRALVEEKAALIRRWQDQGRLARIDPHHLIFSIWATTQHYADFDVQICGILGGRGAQRFSEAAGFLDQLFRGALTP